MTLINQWNVWFRNTARQLYQHWKLLRAILFLVVESAKYNTQLELELYGGSQIP